MIIAFCFGALLEALAGFGTPVPSPRRRRSPWVSARSRPAAVALVANTAPVAFGAIAVPITTLSEVTGLPVDDLGAMVGRQTPLRAPTAPLILVGMVDGTRPAPDVAGRAGGRRRVAAASSRARTTSRSKPTHIVAALLGTGAIVGFLEFGIPPSCCSPSPPAGWPAVAGAESHNPELERDVARTDDTKKDPPVEVLKAYAPYLSSSPSSPSPRSGRSRMRSPTSPSPRSSTGPGWR